MSAKTKTRAQKIGKLLGIALFAFLMFFNIKFAVSDNANGDIDLFGLKISVFTNSTYASSSYYRWYNTGQGGGPGGSTLYLCIMPSVTPECIGGSGGWGF
jgi:hypothetical protein